MSVAPAPAGRDLTRAELRALAAALAARPEQWRHLVHHDPTARTYEQLRRDEHVAIWLICCVVHGGGGPAVTINAYSPPLWRMGAYETTPAGALQRHSISYAEELRPLGLVASA